MQHLHRYNPVHIAETQLRGHLAGDPEGHSVTVDELLLLDDTWIAADHNSRHTIDALMDHISQDGAGILQDLAGRTIEFVYQADDYGGMYAFAVTIPGTGNHPPVTLLSDWHDLRFIGDHTLAGIDAGMAVAKEGVQQLNLLTKALQALANPSTSLTPDRVDQVLRAIETLDQELADSQIVSCRNCNAELGAPQTADIPCPGSDEGHHDPDHVIWPPESDEPQTRRITLLFEATVPNDGYDYAIDVTGRLEQLLGLLLLHPYVTAVGTSGPTGSGYVGDLPD